MGMNPSILSTNLYWFGLV